MKLLQEFIDFGTSCPLCGNAMTLFMSLKKSVCFQAKETFPIEQNYNYGEPKPIFNLVKPTRRLEFVPTFGSGLSPGDNFIINMPPGLPPSIEFATQNCFQKVHKHDLRFFYICNAAAVEKDGSAFGVNCHYSCFYRTSPFMNFVNDTLTLVNEKHNFTNWQEIATIKNVVDGGEKNYILSLDFIESNTKFCYYFIDLKKNAQTFKDKMLEKTFDHIIKRPNFSSSAREKLLNRLESWVWMS